MADSISHSSSFYIDNLENPLRNPFGVLKIHLNDIASSAKEKLNSPIVFAMTNDFTMSAGSDWISAQEQSGMDTSEQDAFNIPGMNTAAHLMGAIEAFMGKKNDRSEIVLGMMSKRIKNIAMSYLSWVRSQTSPFRFTLYKYATRPTDDVVKPFVRLYKAVLPTFYNGVMIETPLGYRPPYADGIRNEFGGWIDTAVGAIGSVWDFIRGENNPGRGYESLGLANKPVPGTITVEIGMWCTIRGLLARNLSFTASKVCTSKGMPLYAKGEIEFVPYRMLVFDDIESILSGHSTLGLTTERLQAPNSVKPLFS